MKLKKIVAVAAAAVLSLAMLTACSGGGGGSASNGDNWIRKLITVEKNGVEVADADAEITYYISNGKWVYERDTGANFEYEYLLSTDGEKYAVNTAAEPWKKYKEPSDSQPMTTTKSEGTDEYKGKPYHTVVYTSIYTDNHTIISTYYYEGGSLKYIKETSEQSGSVNTTVKRVLIDRSGVDSENAAKLDINNYTPVTDKSDLNAE